MARESELKPVRMRAHTVSIEDRTRMSITDVEDVESFNESEIVLITSVGMMTLTGENLHISRLNLDEGHLAVEGTLYTLEYDSKSGDDGGGFFSRMFR